MKLYIAGPMTGYENFNYPAFFEAAGQLAIAGYEVLNPANLGIRDDIPYQYYIKRGIAQVLEADGIALLPGWARSNGANLEIAVGEAIGLPCKDVIGWIKNAKKLNAKKAHR